MKLKDHPLLLMSMVLVSILAGLALAVATFPVRAPLPWGTVIIAAVIGGVAIGGVAGLARRRKRRRKGNP